MRITRLVALVALSIAMPAAARAQASIAGVVKDASDAALPMTTVEAASPVLIEKMRTTQTDSAGQYRIVDLRPGSYVVTFRLTGFGTVKHQAIELTGSSTTTVNVSLTPGAAEEAMTVTRGGSFVDVQGVNRQMTVTSDEIPSMYAG